VIVILIIAVFCKCAARCKRNCSTREFARDVLVSSIFIAIVKPALASSLLPWLRHLGGPGLMLFGLLDSSVIRVPGSRDALTVLLSANQRMWSILCLHGNHGSVVGGNVTYRLVRGEGKEH
jgi:hypothetical protein